VLLLVVEFTLGVFRKGLSLKLFCNQLTLMLSPFSAGSAIYMRFFTTLIIGLELGFGCVLCALGDDFTPSYPLPLLCNG
jgi:hypothetical protein